MPQSLRTGKSSKPCMCTINQVPGHAHRNTLIWQAGWRGPTAGPQLFTRNAEATDRRVRAAAAPPRQRHIAAPQGLAPASARNKRQVCWVSLRLDAKRVPSSRVALVRHPARLSSDLSCALQHAFTMRSGACCQTLLTRRCRPAILQAAATHARVLEDEGFQHLPYHGGCLHRCWAWVDGWTYPCCPRQQQGGPETVQCLRDKGLNPMSSAASSSYPRRAPCPL